MNKQSTGLEPLIFLQSFQIILCMGAASLALWFLPACILLVLSEVLATYPTAFSWYGGVPLVTFVTWIEIGMFFAFPRIILVGIATRAHYSSDEEKQRAGTPLVTAFLQSGWFRDPLDYYIGGPMTILKLIMNGG